MDRKDIGTLVGGLAVVVAIGWLDYITGPEIALGPLYLLPIVLAAWRLGMAEALGVALAASVAWFVADVLYSAEIPVSIWNGCTRLSMFGVVAWSLGRLKASEDRLAVANARLRELLDVETAVAKTDPLTGLLNRRGFVNHCLVELARARRSGAPTGVIYVDLDNFKQVNDIYGHLAGDALLREVAGVIRGAVRDTDVCARIGGDEFAVFCWNPTHEALHVMASRLSERVRDLDAKLAEVGFGASAGVGWFDEPPDHIDEMLSRADREMYGAKQTSRAVARG